MMIRKVIKSPIINHQKRVIEVEVKNQKEKKKGKLLYAITSLVIYQRIFNNKNVDYIIDYMNITVNFCMDFLTIVID